MKINYFKITKGVKMLMSRGWEGYSLIRRAPDIRVRRQKIITDFELFSVMGCRF